jgi:hypothetical protein
VSRLLQPVVVGHDDQPLRYRVVRDQPFDPVVGLLAGVEDNRDRVGVDGRSEADQPGPRLGQPVRPHRPAEQAHRVQQVVAVDHEGHDVLCYAATRVFEGSA